MDNKVEETGRELLTLASEVLKNYDITPKSTAVIQSGSIKTVWKVTSSKGVYCLKRLKQTYDKALFSVHAQIHIRKSGGKVPEVIPSKAGEPIVKHNDQLFVLYEWLDGKDLNFGNSQDLRLGLQGLAAFHAASRSYQPVEESRTSTKLEKWPEQYTSMKTRMQSWKDASSGTGTAYTAYTKSVDGMLRLADKALELLSKSQYGKLSTASSPSIVLCHQDYGTGNALNTNKGVYVLDLDGVTFDLPARDLRKIIGKQAQLHGQWDAAAIRNIINWYSEINPLNAQERELLYIDLMFPHWYFGLVKNLFQSKKMLKSAEIEKIAQLELSKQTVVQELLKKG